MTKQELRREVKRQIALLSKEEREQQSEAVIAQLEAMELFQQSNTLLLYHSLPDEVQTHRFVAKWAESKQLLLPVVVGEELELRRYTPTTPLAQGAYTIREPEGEPFTDFAAIELAIIPGVAFDTKRTRLGRGKGYYDKLLPHLTCPKVALCFPLQLREEAIPAEPHDIPIDAVLTGEQIETKNK